MKPAAVPGEQPAPPSASPFLRAIQHDIAVTHLRSRDGARATVADHGAHLLSWQPAGGGEMLYLSPASGFGNGQAIRGGVPVIFPQFGERGRGRRHGVARLQAWQFHGARHEGEAAVGTWRLAGLLDGPSPASAAGPDCRFGLTLTVRVTGDRLAISLRIDNTGTQAWQAHAALHGYFAVPDLAQARIDGLQGMPFIDNADPAPAVRQGILAGAARIVLPAADGLKPGEPGPVRLAGECDRLYPGAPASLLLTCGSLRLEFGQSGFADTVVWNPGAAKAAALTDLPPGGHTGFVCIEAAAVLSPVVLAPGASWEGEQRLHADRSDCLP